MEKCVNKSTAVHAAMTMGGSGSNGSAVPPTASLAATAASLAASTVSMAASAANINVTSFPPPTSISPSQ
jgi:hypothetical protein